MGITPIPIKEKVTAARTWFPDGSEKMEMRKTNPHTKEMTTVSFL